MSIDRRKQKKKASYAGIDRKVLDHEDYISLSGNAVKLLLELARQYNGFNNGALSASWTLLKKRGFKSKTTLAKAKQELLAHRLIIETRTGRFLNPGGVCSLYALSWRPINECPDKNLEVLSSVKPPRTFA